MLGTLIISDDEFTAMERLLAGLLAHADSESEEAAILDLHARLGRIYEKSIALSASRNRLKEIDPTAGSSRV